MVVFQIVQSVLLTFATVVMAIATVALWRVTSSYANATSKYVGLTTEMLAEMRLRAEEERQERDASLRATLVGQWKRTEHGDQNSWELTLHNAGPGTAIMLSVRSVYAVDTAPAGKNLCNQPVLKAGNNTHITFRDDANNTQRILVEFRDARQRVYRDERRIQDGMQFTVDEAIGPPLAGMPA